MTVVEMYVQMIREGSATLNDVPEMIRERVEKKLIEEEKENENK